MDFDFLSAALHAVDQGYGIGVNVAPDFFQLDYLLAARHAFVACQLVKRRLGQLHHVVVCRDVKPTPFLPGGSQHRTMRAISQRIASSESEIPKTAATYWIGAASNAAALPLAATLARSP
jgi:hypothetical protein